MAHTEHWARRLLRELPKDPQKLLRSKSYPDTTFLPLFFDHLDALIFHDPREGLRWAKVAPELALKLREEDGPAGRRARRELLVKAWAILGGAYRAAGRPGEAEAPHREALKVAESGPVSEPVRADLDRRLSTLRACQGRPDEALALAAGAVENLRQHGGRELIEALIAHGYVLASEFGRFSEAIDAFGEALTLVGDPRKEAEKRVHFVACNNLAMAISDSGSLGDQRKALRYLKQARALLKVQKARTAARYHLQWVEALIWNRTGSHAKAERLFRRSLEGFQALRLPWENALVGLDLGSLLHLAGDFDELEKIAGETFLLFRNLSGADTQTLVALSLWVDAVKARRWKAGDEARRAYDALHEKARQAILAGVFAGRGCRRKRRL